MKWKCENCGKDDPCILQMSEEIPEFCVLDGDDDAIWVKVEEAEKLAKRSQLPKLTAEVFNRPDCPAWAQFAAVDGCGRGFYYEAFPSLYKHDRFFLLSTVHGKTKRIPGKFDGKNWITSIVVRQEKPSLPNWCKVGEWVYTCGGDYRKVEAISDGIVSLSGGLNIPVGDIHSELVKARLRPYNAEEMKALVGKVIEDRHNAHLVIGFIKPDPAENLSAFIRAGQCWIAADKLLTGYTLEGAQCGVLEHIENGEWVR